MKYAYAPLIVVIVLAFVAYFDAIIVFLLSGFIPGINVTLPPSTMLAVMSASTIVMFALKARHIVYKNCLELYDELFGSRKKKDEVPAGDTKADLPRRRYQEL